MTLAKWRGEGGEKFRMENTEKAINGINAEPSS
jgi:hypothetical protein